MSKQISKLGLYLNNAGIPSQGLFVPEHVISLIDTKTSVNNSSLNDIRSDSNIFSTSSFRYDTYSVGVKNTQQFRIDFNRFENHTFFNSAEVNVNVAFEKVINKFPFDGSRKKTEEFFDSLTGFENHVYQSFPKNIGYLVLSGSAIDEQSHLGTYIEVIDSQGAKYSTISPNTTGHSVLSPAKKPFTVDMHLFVPEAINGNQIIAQSISGSGIFPIGFTLALSHSTNTSKANVFFGVTSGSMYATASAEISKGQFNHVVASYDQRSSNLLRVHINGVLEATSKQKMIMLNGMNVFPSAFLIGSGSSHAFPAQNQAGTEQFKFTPKQTLSGAIDEFRYYHKFKTLDDQVDTRKKSVFAGNDLKLYFKFNEPKGNYNLNSLALDSSGNALHSTIENYSTDLRLTGSSTPYGPVPLTSEDININPILFPDFNSVTNLNSTLLLSASRYDTHNPNLITKLIPQHYLNEGYLYESLGSQDGTMGDYISGHTPRDLRMGSQQMIVSLLYVWAKFFDELKISIDQFSNVLFTNYTDLETTPSQLLARIINTHGFEMSNAFQPATVAQWVDGENLDNFISTGESPLSFIQNEIWRRILSNLPQMIQSKGTLHSVKSMFRCIGINPDTTIRIREFGGPSRGVLGTLRENRTEISSMLDFSLTGSSDTAAPLQPWRVTSKPLVTTMYLSSSRKAQGYPYLNNDVGSSDVLRWTWTTKPWESPYYGMSPRPSDGLWTSGSFTFEGTYKFSSGMSGSQSLVRMFTTGARNPYTNTFNDERHLIANVVANPSHGIKLFVNSTHAFTKDWNTLTLPLTGVNIFDGNKWNISFGRFRDDDPAIGSPGGTSSSFFLRVARQNFGEVTRQYTTSTFYSTAGGNVQGDSSWSDDLFTRNKDAWTDALYPNMSGAFLCFGTENILTTSRSGYESKYFLNSVTSDNPAEARIGNFSGKLGQVRFWSKGLSETEWLEHVRNFKSVGVDNPLLNYNFISNEKTKKQWNLYKQSGSFERIRLDLSMDQVVSSTNDLGQLEIFDFTQQTITGATPPWYHHGEKTDKIFYHASGTNFASTINAFSPERYDYSILSPKFDESVSNQKVRVKSYIDPALALRENVQLAPFNDVDLLEQSTDDARFSIDFSTAQAIDEDIILIFATFKELETAIGDPTNRFSPDYKGLANLRKVYFDRLSKKVNFKNFFDFFQWFDTNYGTFVKQLIPDTTHYLGTNYVIESHMLERHKIQMLNGDLYLTGEPSIIKGEFNKDFYDGDVGS